jgi:hypothetical protein
VDIAVGYAIPKGVMLWTFIGDNLFEEGYQFITHQPPVGRRSEAGLAKDFDPITSHPAQTYRPISELSGKGLETCGKSGRSGQL